MSSNIKVENLNKLDRKAFAIHSVDDADYQLQYWQGKGYDDRLKAATYLIACAWSVPQESPPRLDRSIFAITKRSGGN